MRIKPILLIFGLLLTGACSHTDKSPVSVVELIGTEWGLEEIDGSRVADRVQSTLLFQRGDRVVGWGGCNRYFAGLRSDGDVIHISPIGSTRRICPPVVMDQENRFFEVLKKARNISMQDPYLIIDSKGVEDPLKFIMIKP
jgi:heat shock protein HslJ